MERNKEMKKFIKEQGDNLYFKDVELNKKIDKYQIIYYKLVGTRKSRGLDCYDYLMQRCDKELMLTEDVPLDNTTKALGTRKTFQLKVNNEYQKRTRVDLFKSDLFNGLLYETKPNV